MDAFCTSKELPSGGESPPVEEFHIEVLQQLLHFSRDSVPLGNYVDALITELDLFDVYISRKFSFQETEVHHLF